MAYYEVTQGTDREETQMHVVTNWDHASSALLARNSYQPQFKDHVTFAAANPVATSYSGDRRLFLGRNRSLLSPVALQHKFLSRRSGAGLDPCLALQTAIDLRPGEERDVILPIGQASSLQQARALIQRYRDPLYFEEALASTKAWWDSLLSTIEVTTPEDETNWLLNRWLMYQTLACRIWARSAFYQSGGAFGFRDQLQDTMAAVYVLPRMARDHIVLAASRQFREGDVQHWWHQVSGAGVRTRCSDDLLWLPYVACHYAQVSGDEAIFDVQIPFLEGPALAAIEHELYFIPSVSIEDGTLFEHCVRAVRKASEFGPHGLPLIGSGDWNDGMNRVGIEGRGESVWLGWFFVEVLKKLMPVCERRQENELLAEFQRLTDRMIAGLESQGWDGEWYRRAYFDDGTPIGSDARPEARIDSLPQSWAAIALGKTDRTEQAMAAAQKYLVRDKDKIVLLFDPPFDKSTPHPGYIMGYPPGVRENGGQYTHGALWMALAYARLGDGTRAVELLRMMSPIAHSRTAEDALRYKGEPYAVAADVYALEGQEGRAGWTWYTGSSGWMYRVWIEEILGFKLRGDRFSLEPCLPKDWKGFSFRYNYGESSYTVTVENPDGVSQGVVFIEVNGEKLADKWIPLKDNGKNNRILIRMGIPEKVQEAQDQEGEGVKG
ncbi:MAG: glycosyltransferase 36 associated protein [Acidobacteria bacterium]|nr:MAG: glycosyltransferase 36 associated protein [Acidobacteriota bacterium]